MISVDEALKTILSRVGVVSTETVSIASAFGRVLAEDVAARLRQPPQDVSAMDGYAVRSVDAASTSSILRLVGEAPAGGSYKGKLKQGETVRIFTGGPMPTGADAVVIQEDVSVDGVNININEPAQLGRHIRKGGLDFEIGDIGAAAGRKLTSRDIALISAMNAPWVSVRRRPRIALLATGTELVKPGEAVGPNQIISSNSLGLAAFAEGLGATAVDLGIAADDADHLAEKLDQAANVDMLITIGGASVGDYDLVQDALKAKGMRMDFWKIAMRPGKPLMFGSIDETLVLGLPGNPVSAYVGALVFLKPAIEAMLGLSVEDQKNRRIATLATDLPPNGARQDHMRAKIRVDPDGALAAQVFGVQDSSMLSALAQSDGLIVRPPNDPARKIGDSVTVLLLNEF
jgi:molybdopterin molybdotransferase